MDEQQGSYKLSEFGDTSIISPEVQRLKDQVQYTLKKEKQYWRLLDLPDDIKIVEPGSGPGWMTKELLAYWPNSTVTAVEIDPDMNQLFRQILSPEELQRVEVVEKSITNTDLPADTYDIAIVRAVLQHVPDTKAAIREMFRILKKGGILYILDRDDGASIIYDPKMPLNDALQEKVAELYQEAKGGHPYISRYLPKMLMDAGFKDIDLHGIVMHSALMDREEMRKTNNIESFSPLLTQGIVTQEEAEAVIKESEAFINNPDSLFVSFGFVTIGTK